VLRARLSLCLLLVVGGAPSVAHAQMFVTTGRDTLRGLPGVEVLVEPIQSELEAVGLTTAGLTRDVTEQLTAAGVTIYPSQRDNPSPSKPYVYVHISAVGGGRGGDVAVGIQLHLRQTLVSLTTASRIVNAMSWDQHSVTMAPPGSLRGEIATEVRSLTARFIADWKAVH
jgi:hypothetical protein